MDKDQLSVSGLSSGAFFAVQFHVAFSETVMGAGIVAGGKLLIAKHENINFFCWYCMLKQHFLAYNMVLNSSGWANVSMAVVLCMSFWPDQCYQVNPCIVNYYNYFLLGSSVYYTVFVQ